MSGVRKPFTYVSYLLGAAMIIVGLASVVGAMSGHGSPRPEIATTGVTLIMATGLVGSMRNGR